MRRILLLAFTLLQTLWAHAQAKDTIYFHNRTKIVGELHTIKLGRLEFDADGITVITVKNTKISSVYARSRDFRIETISGEIFHGILLPSEIPGVVTIESLGDSTEIALEDIAIVNKYGRTWQSRTSGYVSAGYTFTKSSNIGRLNFDSQLKYTARRSETILTANLIVTSDSVEVSRERENFTLSHSYFFANLWEGGGFIRYQRNLELGLEQRWQQALALGRKFFFSQHQVGLLLSGIAINQELSVEQEFKENTEVVLIADYDFYSFQNPNITLGLLETVFFSLTEEGRYRVDGDLNLTWEFIKDFSVSLQFYHNYDSKSPATGGANTDYGFVAGLKFKF